MSGLGKGEVDFRDVMDDTVGLAATRSFQRPSQLEVSPGIVLDSRRALWLERERTLAVADLHLGFVWAHRAEGNLMPLSRPEETVEQLSTLAREYAARSIVLLGDIVHRAVPIEPLREELRRLCCALGEVELQLVAGNHDRALAAMLAECNIAHPLTAEVRIGPHRFLHGDRMPAQAELPPGGKTFIGHEHPALTLGDGISRMKCPCFLVRPDLLVLPAFSPWAAGTDVRSGIFLSPLSMRAKFNRAVVILGERLLAVPL
jgi:putative SbcD/Mre11-related phosphoesterase